MSRKPQEQTTKKPPTNCAKTNVRNNNTKKKKCRDSPDDICVILTRAKLYEK